MTVISRDVRYDNVKLSNSASATVVTVISRVSDVRYDNVKLSNSASAAVVCTKFTSHNVRRRRLKASSVSYRLIYGRCSVSTEDVVYLEGEGSFG